MTTKQRDRDELFIATDSGVAQGKDELYTFVSGRTRVRAGHELLTLAGHAFAPIDEHIHYDVDEKTTSEPGTKRGQ